MSSPEKADRDMSSKKGREVHPVIRTCTVKTKHLKANESEFKCRSPLFSMEFIFLKVTLTRWFVSYVPLTLWNQYWESQSCWKVWKRRSPAGSGQRLLYTSSLFPTVVNLRVGHGGLATQGQGWHISHAPRPSFRCALWVSTVIAQFPGALNSVSWSSYPV